MIRMLRFFRKSQLSTKIIFSIILSLIVLTVIFFSFNQVNKLKERAASAEIINLETSIAAKILQQSTRPEGTTVNFTVSIPSSVSEICFFDAGKKYDSLKNPEITNFFSDDSINNLFLLEDAHFLKYHLDNFELSENPLCARIINNKINLKLVSQKQKTLIFADKEAAKCVAILENGPSDKKVDFVFLGYGFGSIEEYNSQVNRYINNILLAFEPYKQYKNKFNFYRIDDAKISCKITDFIECGQYEIKLAASDCPNDIIILLADRALFKDFIKPVRSSAISNIVKINTADKPFVLVHELGHSFADLADEYVDESYYSDKNFNPLEYSNCDISPCLSWNSVNSTGCYEGCSLQKYFRPTKESIMRSLSSTIYGPVNEREILKRLLYYE